MSTNTTKRYAIFSKKTWKKTGTIKATRKFATRAEARAFKRGQDAPRNWGIMDIVAGTTVR